MTISSEPCRPHPSRCAQLLADFDQAWRAGLRPRIEDFLPPPGTARVAEADRLYLLAELVHIDLEGRWRQYRSQAGAGTTNPAETSSAGLVDFPLLEDYVRHFPALGGLQVLPLELICSEYFARRLWGDQPAAAEYLARFAGRAAELQPALAEIDAELEREFACAAAPSPGGAGNLADRTFVHCPHCRSGLPVDSGPLGTVQRCAACGGQFTLDEAQGTADRAPPLPRVGRYVLGQRLGVGAFGSVWQAFDTELRRHVAIKLPRTQLLDGEDEERFLREARAAASLRHEGIVQVLDSGRESGTLYIVTELVHGPSLADLVARDRPGFRESAALVALVADALNHAHGQGVVHRDLKPSNILLQTTAGGARVPKLADFGLAKRGSADITMTLDGTVLGTPAFMSPEQVRASHQADPRSDIYSLGVVLYQLLTGELPFTGLTPMVLEQVLHEEPRRPRQLNQRIPADLETMVLKCLAKEPRHRYAAAAALAADLRRWLAGEPIHARPAGLAERAWRWARRKPLVAGLSAAVGGMLVLLGVVLVQANLRISRERDAALAAQQESDASAARALAALHRAEENEKAAQDARKRADADRDRALDSFATLIMLADRQLQQVPGSQNLRSQILQTAVANLERMASESGKAGAQRSVFFAYMSLGKLHRSVGQSRAARKYYERALQAAEEAARIHPGPWLIHSDLAAVYINLAEINIILGDPQTGRSYFDRARAQAEAVLREDPRSENAQRYLAHAYGNLVEAGYDLGGDARQWEEYIKKSCALIDAVDKARPGEYQNDVGLVYLRAAQFAARRRELAEAQQLLSRSYAALHAGWLNNRFDPRALQNLASVCMLRGMVFLHQRKRLDAEASFLEACKLCEAAARGDPQERESRQVLAQCHRELSAAKLAGGDLNAGRHHAQEAVANLEALASTDPNNVSMKRLLAGALEQLGQVGLVTAAPEGFDALTQVVRLREEVLATDPQNSQLQAELAQSCLSLGAYHLRLRRFAEAVPWYQRCLALLDQINPAFKVAAQGRNVRQEIQEFLEICKAVPQALKDLQFALEQPPPRPLTLLIIRGSILARGGDQAAALATVAKLEELGPTRPEHLFGLACCLALCAKFPADTPETQARQATLRRRALAALQRAVDAGFHELSQIVGDQDLAALRDQPAYQDLVKRLQALP